MITIDDFRKIELKIATIKEVLDHPNADRLYVIKVSLGAEERQVVAGIKAYYKPEELVGKQVVLVSNLESALLRGVESQGMILAASDVNGVRILIPGQPMELGSIVK